MNKVLKDLPFIIAYQDDITIYTKTVEEHLNHLQQVFHKLWNAMLSMKLRKYHFFTQEIQYLGHILSGTGTKCLPLKMEAIKIMWPPKNAKHTQAFLGLVGYYQKFIKNFAWIRKPLTTLTHHNATFNVTLNHQATLISMKEALIQAPILRYPDPSRWYIVYMDVSDDACAALILQDYNGQELPVTFLSDT